jgi:hypothetical protein
MEQVELTPAERIADGDEPVRVGRGLFYERAVESGLKTPRPRRRKLGRRDEAYLGPRPWCSATRPGPLAS